MTKNKNVLRWGIFAAIALIAAGGIYLAAVPFWKTVGTEILRSRHVRS